MKKLFVNKNKIKKQDSMEKMKEIEIYKINNSYSCNIDIKNKYIRTSSLSSDELIEDLIKFFKDEKF